MQDSLYNIVFTVFYKYNICSKKGQEMYGYRKETVKNMLTKAPECAKISFADFKRLDAPLPQLDRGLGYEPRRRGFESLKARQNKWSDTVRCCSICFCAIYSEDSNPERATSVKKICRWHIFSKVGAKSGTVS